MEVKEFLAKIKNQQIDQYNVNRIKSRYGNEMPTTLKKLISGASKGVSIGNGMRIISVDEIIIAADGWNIDFIEMGIIPIIDCGDSNFIVYSFEDDIWYKFNIVGHYLFEAKGTLVEYFK